MTENFEVAQSSSEGELSDSKRHEVVAAQLRGEAKVAGQGAEAVVAAVAEELEGIGLEPNPAELHRRYEEIDPDLPVLGDAEESSGGEEGETGEAGEVPADAGTPPSVRTPGPRAPSRQGSTPAVTAHRWTRRRWTTRRWTTHWWTTPARPTTRASEKAAACPRGIPPGDSAPARRAPSAGRLTGPSRCWRTSRDPTWAPP
jgi:hypothetical protein